MGGKCVLELRQLVEGSARGRLLVYDGYISFYGEVDPYTGMLEPLGQSITGRILVFRGARGSTVGPYILYALHRRGRGPTALIVEEPDPLIVAAAVISETPLAVGEKAASILREKNGVEAELRELTGGRAELVLADC